MSHSNAWSWAKSRSTTPQDLPPNTSPLPPSTTTTTTSPKPRRPSITALLNFSSTSSSLPTLATITSPSPPCETTTTAVSTLNATTANYPAGTTAAPTPNMSRKMQRSYSQSHSRTGSYMMTSHGAAPALGQGATVVRTPSDATMFMAQPGAQGHWPSRQSSLRIPPRRPSDGGQLPDCFAPRINGEVAPLLPPVQIGTFGSDFRDAFGDNTAHNRAPSRTLSRSPSAPHQSRAAVDTSRGYTPGRRVTGRPSNSTLKASQPLSGATRQQAAPSSSPRTSPEPCPSPSLLRSDSQQSVSTRASPPPYMIPTRSPPSPPRVSPTLCREPSCTRLNTSGHVHPRPSNASEDTLTPRVRTIMPATPPIPVTPLTRDTPPPILISHSVRTTSEASSIVLVTLRFSFSLDAEPNTHSVTVTLDTLRPAGGRLIEFLDKILHPTPQPVPAGPHSSGRDSGIGGSGTGTPMSTGSSPEPSLEMTDSSSAEDSDFEYDNMYLHPSLMDEYVVAQTLASAPKTPTDAPPRPARRQFPPTAYPYAGLPPLADLPAALAQAKAAAEAKAQKQQASRGGRPRASTCPGPAVGVVTEVTILLQREAGAWHAIASRLCSGSWPCLDGRRRRVEDECKWAGMDALVAELRAPTGVVRTSASGARVYI